MNITAINGIVGSEKLSIGEISKYLGINISTLRYWEEEFKQFLRPERTEGGQRRYSAENIKILQEIKYLIEVEKYTIEGAKRRMIINRKKEREFKDILEEAIKEVVEKGKDKKEVIENIVQREWIIK